MKKDMSQFLVIGLGGFGVSLCKSLYEKDCDVLAIDQNRELIDRVQEFTTQALSADATDETVLKELGIKNFDAVVVCIGDVESSVFVTLLCKQLGAKYIMSKANNSLQKTVLEKVGADAVIFPEEYMGEKVADMLTHPNILEIAKLTPNFSIIEIKTPEIWAEKSLMELELRKNQNVTVLLVKRGENVQITPDGQFVLKLDDDLVLCGAKKHIDKLKHYATIEIKNNLN